MIELGLVGEKLGHSLSPQIHTVLFRLLGLDARYRLIEVPRGSLGSCLAKLRCAGMRGLNVTIPYKLEAMSFVDRLSPEAERIGALNTISWVDGAVGFNTDCLGFATLLDRAGVETKSAAVLGSGGAARAVIQALIDRGCRNIILASRRPEGVPTGLGDRPGVKTIGYGELEGRGGDVIVNCTPVGMFPDIGVSPVSDSVLSHWKSAVDVVYNPPQTRFLEDARRRGLKTANGLTMLIAQALASEEIWLGCRFNTEIAVAVEKEMHL